MNRINQKSLEKYNISDLQILLEAIKEMIFFPLQNKYDLSKNELKEMKKDIQTVLNNNIRIR